MAAIKRDDVPPLILNAIVERLAQPPAKNRLQDPRRAYRERQKTTRNDLIYSVYYELLEALTTGVGPSFPALAELVDTARTPSIPHEEAMRLTQVFLSDQLKLRPPGIDRMRNIISEKSRLYRDVFGMK